MSKELNPYYKRVSTYIISKEDLSGNDWEYIRQFVLGGNSTSACRIAYPSLTEKQIVNKNASLAQNKVIQQEIENFTNQLETNKEKALKEIYQTIGELQLDRSYIMKDLVQIKNGAMANGDYASSIRATDLLIKMLGYYTPVKSEVKTDINISFGGWTPNATKTALPSHDSSNITDIQFKEIDYLERDSEIEED